MKKIISEAITKLNRLIFNKGDKNKSELDLDN